MIGDEKRGEGESVATYWGRIMAECQHGPIEIANKHGEVIAVMVSKDWWDEHGADGG